LGEEEEEVEDGLKTRIGIEGKLKLTRRKKDNNNTKRTKEPRAREGQTHTTSDRGNRN
jgi:hypothetical protein